MVKFGRPEKKDPVTEAQAEEADLRARLEAAEVRRRELEERNAKTPLIVASNERAVVETPEEPPKLTLEQERLEKLVREWGESYDGAFPELGPSAHASVVRGLLLAIYSELRLLRQSKK